MSLQMTYGGGGSINFALTVNNAEFQHYLSVLESDSHWMSNCASHHFCDLLSPLLGTRLPCSHSMAAGQEPVLRWYPPHHGDTQ